MHVSADYRYNSRVFGSQLLKWTWQTCTCLSWELRGRVPSKYAQSASVEVGIPCPGTSHVELWICPTWPQNWKTGTRKFWDLCTLYTCCSKSCFVSDVPRRTFKDSVCLALNLYLKPKGVDFKCLVWCLDSKSVCLWYLVVLGLEES